MSPSANAVTSIKALADQQAANVPPVIREIRCAGARSLHQITGFECVGYYDPARRTVDVMSVAQIAGESPVWRNIFSVKRADIPVAQWSKNPPADSPLHRIGRGRDEEGRGS